MFSLVIENTSHHNYFTEKITDAIICKTVPIYWGCTNINEYYDSRGIIYVRSDDEAINVINKLTENDYYNRIDYINYNYKKAFEYNNYVKRIKIEIENIFKLNNII